MAKHIDCYLGLLQNNMPQEGFVSIISIQTHIDKNHFIRNRAKTIYFDFNRSAGLTPRTTS